MRILGSRQRYALSIYRQSLWRIRNRLGLTWGRVLPDLWQHTARRMCRCASRCDSLITATSEPSASVWPSRRRRFLFALFRCDFDSAANESFKAFATSAGCEKNSGSSRPSSAATMASSRPSPAAPLVVAAALRDEQAEPPSMGGCRSRESTGWGCIPTGLSYLNVTVPNQTYDIYIVPALPQAP